MIVSRQDLDSSSLAEPTVRILVVEDDRVLADGLVEALEDEFYSVDLAMDGESASELAAVNLYDLVILDWTIPPPTGIELLGRWRSDGMETPVLMLTGRAEVESKVDGLDAGADDYLVKPFRLAELMARVRSLLRRRQRPMEAPLTLGDVAMDRGARTVQVAGAQVELSPKEFALLEYLLRRQEEVVTRTDLIEHVWDDSFDSMSNVVDVTVYRLRKKIDAGRESPLLRTIKGVGYVLGPPRG